MYFFLPQLGARTASYSESGCFHTIRQKETLAYWSFSLWHERKLKSQISIFLASHVMFFSIIFISIWSRWWYIYFLVVVTAFKKPPIGWEIVHAEVQRNFCAACRNTLVILTLTYLTMSLHPCQDHFSRAGLDWWEIIAAPFMFQLSH